jgi:class 3 adenylate cyclase
MAQPATDRNAMDRLSLRFLDDELEQRYQGQAGAESLSGFLLISLASAVIWAPAAFILPLSTSLEPGLAIPVGLGMSGLSLAVAGLARWAKTLDRQHFLASVLTTANGSLIITLAAIGGALPGYAVAAVLAIFAWGYVSRTRFIYAALRTGVIALAFGVAVATYTGPANLVLDVLLFSVGAVGVLIALRLVERGRRLLFVQDLVIHEQGDQLATEMKKSETLLHNVMPARIAARLLGGEQTIADDYPSVTVLFADIVGFTPLSAQLEARAVIDLLGRLFVAFDRIKSEHDLVKIKTIGDSYMAVGGLTPGEDDHAAAVVRFGLAMLEEAGRHEALGQPLQLRIGVNSGPVVGGVIGTQRLAFDLWGDTVNVASRLQELAPPGRLVVSERTMLLIRDEFAIEPLGPTDVRGHSRMNVYAIASSETRPSEVQAVSG